MNEKAPKIFFVEMEEEWQKEYVRKALPEASPLSATAQESAREIQAAEILSVFIKSRLDRALIETLPKLKLIATRSTGFDQH